MGISSEIAELKVIIARQDVLMDNYEKALNASISARHELDNIVFETLIKLQDIMETRDLNR